MSLRDVILTLTKSETKQRKQETRQRKQETRYSSHKSKVATPRAVADFLTLIKKSLEKVFYTMKFSSASTMSILSLLALLGMATAVTADDVQPSVSASRILHLRLLVAGSFFLRRRSFGQNFVLEHQKLRPKVYFGNTTSTSPPVN
jgi:hypothetical protein